jgi:nucleoside diphosphate kinase
MNDERPKKVRLIEALEQHPTMPDRDMAKVVGCDPSYVHQLKAQMGITRPRKSRDGKYRTTLYLSMDNIAFLKGSRRGEMTASDFADGALDKVRIWFERGE